MSVLKLIHNNTKTIGNLPALSFRENGVWKSKNWREFGEELAQISNGLSSLGMRAGDKLGIFSDNSKDWVLVDFANQSLGAITVPIYATNSKEQVEFILRQTEIKVILVGAEKQLEIVREIKQNSEFADLQVISSIQLENPTEQEYYLPKWKDAYDKDFQYKDIDINDTATILYTSGTTGTPKGVVLTHKNFDAVIKAHKEFFNIDNLHNKVSMAL